MGVEPALSPVLSHFPRNPRIPSSVAADVVCHVVYLFFLSLFYFYPQKRSFVRSSLFFFLIFFSLEVKRINQSFKRIYLSFFLSLFLSFFPLFSIIFSLSAIAA